MQSSRPIVLSIAGLDPCGGAGLLADIKTFEQHKVYGLGIATAITVQTDSSFYSARWEGSIAIMDSLEKLFLTYKVQAVKIGIIENVDVMGKIITIIQKMAPEIKIIWDPVFKSSTGFNFWDTIDHSKLFELLSKVCLVTPNIPEALQLLPTADAKKSAAELSAYCRVLLTGGHSGIERGTDYLFTNKGEEKINGNNNIRIFPKHGSGCVLSAAITANIALGFDIVTACTNAKLYVEEFLSSNKTLLGYHHV